MAARQLATLVGAFVLAAGCGSRASVLPRGTGGTDGGSDAGPPRDAGSPDTALGRALHCELTPDLALRAAVREVACWVDDDDFPGNDPTVRGLVEAWEAGLFGSWEPYLGNWLAGFRERSCKAWRCSADARSCAEHHECDEADRVGGPCEFGIERCEGDTIVRCIDGEGLTRIFDCSAVGARCNSAVCQLEGCDFGLFAESLQCEGDALSLCDGAATAPCANHGPGFFCSSFYISGEIPTRWCGPDPEGRAGAYNSPVTCAAGRISFESVSGATYRFDCLANGYDGCDERGCLP